MDGPSDACHPQGGRGPPTAPFPTAMVGAGLQGLFPPGTPVGPQRGWGRQSWATVEETGKVLGSRHRAQSRARPSSARAPQACPEPSGARASCRLVRLRTGAAWETGQTCPTDIGTRKTHTGLFRMCLVHPPRPPTPAPRSSVGSQGPLARKWPRGLGLEAASGPVSGPRQPEHGAAPAPCQPGRLASCRGPLTPPRDLRSLSVSHQPSDQQPPWPDPGRPLGTWKGMPRGMPQGEAESAPKPRSTRPLRIHTL